MGHTQKAQSGYQPTWQAGADTNFQQNQSTISNAGQNLATNAIPAYQGVYNSTANNPYYQQAQSGANDAASTAQQFVAPSQLQGAGQEMLAGQQAGQQANTVQGYLANIMSSYGISPQYMGRAQKDANSLYAAIPQATQGFNLAQPAYDSAMGKANSVYDQQSSMANQIYGLDMGMAGATIPGQIQAANQVLQTGYDPQNALYDRTYQQLMEQQNAQNAQQGVSGSPFAAGVNGQTASNFNIDWQNQQLQRQLQALSGYSGAMTNATGNFNTLVNGGAGGTAGGLLNSAASNYANLSGAGTDQFNSLTNGATSNLNTLTTSADQMIQNAKTQQYQELLNSRSNAVNNYSTMAGVYGNLQNQQNSDYANASDLGAAGLNTMTTASMYPNQVYMNQQNQILQALNAMVGGTNQSLAPSQMAASNDINYMKTGQSATQLQQNAAQQNNAAQSSMLGGLSSMAGMALAPFTGGMSLMAPSIAGGLANGNIGGLDTSAAGGLMPAAGFIPA